MEYLMGIKGKDFVMICGDTTAVQQIITIKHDEDKLREVDSHKIMALAGEPGDRVQFSEYIMANVRLYSLRNGQQLTTDAVANYTRGELATALRKVMCRWCKTGQFGCSDLCFEQGHAMQKPYQVNILFAGFDDRAGASLYWMDYLATMHKMNIAGTGYGALGMHLLLCTQAAADQNNGDCRFILCLGHA